MNAAVQELLDRAEVTDLVYRLGACLDEGRFDEMPSLFVEEATAQTPGGTAEGRDAVVAQAARNHRPTDHVQHVITNVLIERHGDEANVRANLVVHFAARGEAGGTTPAPPVRFTLGEIYRFDVVRTPGGFRFRRVETVPLWMSGTFDRPPAPTP